MPAAAMESAVHLMLASAIVIGCPMIALNVSANLASPMLILRR